MVESNPILECLQVQAIESFDRKIRKANVNATKIRPLGCFPISVRSVASAALTHFVTTLDGCRWQLLVFIFVHQCGLLRDFSAHVNKLARYVAVHGSWHIHRKRKYLQDNKNLIASRKNCYTHTMCLHSSYRMAEPNAQLCYAHNGTEKKNWLFFLHMYRRNRTITIT